MFFACYGFVFIAEIVGDKLLYTTGVLATRYPPLSIVLGMVAAFMCKMGVAVGVGNAISHLPKTLVAVITALSFLSVAITLWRKPDVRAPKAKDSQLLSGGAVAFMAIVLSEWGDVGQITAAGLAAKYVWSARATHTPWSTLAAALVVWLAAVAAMATKGLLAAYLGAGMRTRVAGRVSPKLVRYAGTGALLVLGVLAVLETLGIFTD